MRHDDRRQVGVEVVRGVDLDVQVEPVGRDDLEHLVGRVGEPVARVEALEPATLRGRTVGGDTGRGGTGGGSSRAPSPIALPTPAIRRRPPTTTRGRRPLMRVTIS